MRPILGRYMTGMKGHGPTSLRPPVAEWRELLYRNTVNFTGWLVIWILGVLAFALVGWGGQRLTGHHPSGRFYFMPFAFILAMSVTAAIIAVMRFGVALGGASEILKESRRGGGPGNESPEADAILRQRHSRAYAFGHPRSVDVVIALAAGIAAAAIAWQSS